MKTLTKHLMLGVLITGLLASTSVGFAKEKRVKNKHTPTHGERVSILLSETNALPDPALANTPVVLPEAQTNETWSQPGGNASKTMGHLALAAHVEPVWHRTIAGNGAGGAHGGRLAAPPVVSDGKLFVVDTLAHVYAFDAKTGAQLWVVDFGTNKERKIVYGGGVSTAEGMVFVTDGIGDVGALNANTGKVIWKKRPAGPLRGAPAVANGALYVTTQDNQLFSLSTADGSALWPSPATSALEFAGVFGVANPAIAQGTVVEGFSSGELNAYRYENGRAVWGDALSRTNMSTSVAALSDIDASPVIDRGRVFSIGAGGRMVAVDLITGQRIWEINMAGLAMPWVVGEWIFAVADDGKLHCITRGTGKIRWTLLLPHTVKNKPDGDIIQWSGPVLAGGRLVLTSSHGEIAEVSPVDGSLLHYSRGSGAMNLPPIVANNMMYTLDDTGHLTAWR